MIENSLDFASMRFLNEAAIKEHALECSKRCRAGKFTRVGSEFIDEVKADVERMVREIRAKFPTQPYGEKDGTGASVTRTEPVPSELVFATGVLMDRLQAELDLAIARLIQNKVRSQPSCGVTLGRTR